MLGLGIRVAVGLAVVWISVKLRGFLRSKWLLRKLPGPKGDLLVGQLPVLASAQHHNILAQWAAQFGGIYKMRLAHINVSVFWLAALPAIMSRMPCEQEGMVCAGGGGHRPLPHCGSPGQGHRDREEHRRGVLEVQHGVLSYCCRCIPCHLAWHTHRDGMAAAAAAC